MMGFGFDEPLVLLALLLLPGVMYLYNTYRKKKKAVSLRFSSLRSIKAAKPKAHKRQHVPFYLLTACLIVLILGLADPHLPWKQSKEGVNVVLAIDDSGSMSASDYQPTRLEAAKDAASILIESLDDNDHVGIVVFESGATTAAYLTPFKDKALDRLAAIEQRQGRTAIGDGLSLAIDMATSIPNKKKVVILLSDGVNNAGVVPVEEAVAFAKLHDIQVHTIGMGSEEPVVIGHDFFGNPQYAQLDEQTLHAIAQAAGGTYYKSVNTDTLDEIYRSISDDIEREWEDTSIKDVFILSAIVLLIAILYVAYGKYRIVL